MTLEDYQELETLDLQESKEDLEKIYKYLSQLETEEDASREEFEVSLKLQDNEM